MGDWGSREQGQEEGEDKQDGEGTPGWLSCVTNTSSQSPTNGCQVYKW